MTSRAYGARSPRSHYDVIFIVTLFATELATPTVTDVRTPYRVLYIKIYDEMSFWRRLLRTYSDRGCQLVV